MNLSVRQLSIRLGEFDLRDISLEVAAGEYFVLLGPTGAGKSVLIECVAGLHRPAAGRVLLGERDVTFLRPEHREIGYVPQDYALFPNMTVRANIAFGLRVRRTPAGEARKRVESLAEMLGIGHLLGRHPLNLSGGEKQRAALARALAVQPKVLLLDEPLAAVDEMTRERLCAELLEIQRRAGVTVVHISHSLEETLAVADRIGIMNAGRMVQAGTPAEIFTAPRTRFVAEFTRTENLLPLAGAPEPAGDGLVRAPLAGGEVLLAPAGAPAPSVAAIRPESIQVAPAGASGPAGGLPAAVVSVGDRGHAVRVQARSDGGALLTALLMRADARALGIRPGDRVSLRIHPEDVHLL